MKKFLSTKYASNILSIISILLNIIIAVIGWILVYRPHDNIEKNSLGNNNAVFIFIFLFIVLVINLFLTIINIIRQIQKSKSNRNQSIIDTLCNLQNTYVISPNYVTALQHGYDSKEKDLTEGGCAKILTNSLKYDMSFLNEIADNIIRGAKYIYILPSTNIVFDDLDNYIFKLSDCIHNKLSGKSGVSEMHKKFLTERVEFWLFSDKIPCIYNFAIFRQNSQNNATHFTQSWWYINPSDSDPKSYMLSKEIQPNQRDQNELDNVFCRLYNDVLQRQIK